MVSQTTAVWALEFNTAILADALAMELPPPPATLCEVTETPQAAITLTDKAAEKIGELLGGQAEGAEQALRVAVRGGGCSGFQYALAFDKPKEDDNVFEVDGVAVVVDKVSMQFVFGSEVDYVEGLQGAGFQVNNPNVVAACGCGSSFQVKEDAAEQPPPSSRAAIRSAAAATAPAGAVCRRLRRPPAARRRAPRPARRTRTSPRRCRRRRAARR